MAFRTHHHVVTKPPVEARSYGLFIATTAGQEKARSQPMGRGVAMKRHMVMGRMGPMKSQMGLSWHAIELS